MMKRFTFLMLMMMVFGSLSFGQYTATLQNVTASPNQTVSVNLSVTGFTNIMSMQFFINVNPAVLTFQNITNFSAPSGGQLTYNSSGNQVSMIWTNVTPSTWANGTLLTLNFLYNGTSSAVSFDPLQCEVVAAPFPTILSGSFTNGSVSPFMGNAAQATIGDVVSPLGTVAVPVTYTGFPTNVGSMTQKIAYDPTKLTFISVTGTGNLSSGLNSNVSGGIITITWTSPTGKNINAPGSQLNLNFSYTMLSATDVDFSTGCVITTAAAANIAVSYNNGSVSPPPVITSFASLPALNTAVQGQLIDVPLTLSGFPSNTTNFNINLTYDNPRMSFVGVYNAVQPVTYYANGGNISITNSNPLTPTPSINSDFLVLRFMYNGVGTAAINFAAGCQFNNGSPIGVGYTNGSVSPAPATGNATIAQVAATSPSTVAIPVTFTDLPTNIGAVTMFIAFDDTKLTYVNATNPNSATVKMNGNVISVAWTSASPVNINGAPFVTLNFNYAAASNASASVYFTDGCQVANSSAVIVPVNWNNGGVNFLFKVSGILTYNSEPNPAMPLVGHTVYLKTSPGDVTVATATTDATGFYELWAGNGNYTIDATPNTGYLWYADFDDVVAMFDYSFGIPLPYQNPLRIAAGDVNQNGDIDFDDVVDVFERTFGNILPDYTAPDWIYEHPAVNVSGANVPNVNIMGLCSGNVLGTNPTP